MVPNVSRSAKIKDVPKIPFVTPLFTSEEVTIQPLIPEGKDYNMNVDNFGRGSEIDFSPMGAIRS